MTTQAKNQAPILIAVSVFVALLASAFGLYSLSAQHRTAPTLNDVNVAEDVAEPFGLDAITVVEPTQPASTPTVQPEPTASGDQDGGAEPVSEPSTEPEPSEPPADPDPTTPPVAPPTSAVPAEPQAPAVPTAPEPQPPAPQPQPPAGPATELPDPQEDPNPLPEPGSESPPALEDPTGTKGAPAPGRSQVGSDALAMNPVTAKQKLDDELELRLYFRTKADMEEFCEEELGGVLVEVEGLNQFWDCVGIEDEYLMHCFRNQDPVKILEGKPYECWFPTGGIPAPEGPPAAPEVGALMDPIGPVTGVGEASGYTMALISLPGGG